MSNIEELKNNPFWYHFLNICNIPHGSGNEKQISDYVCTELAKYNIDFFKDEFNNVFAIKPATVGYENHDAVMLQGHMDMVCEKNKDSKHDFTKDPLNVMVKDNYIMADGTTLGADDGVAVAVMLTILQGNFKHPRIECLFTVDEERGMTGAAGFDYSKVTATKLINLDSEDENVITVSCVGGTNILVKFSHSYSPISPACTNLKITLKGLAGGHSGSDIHLCRQNSIKLLVQLLKKLYTIQPFRLISIDGGNMENAIPRECEAVISVRDKDSAIDILTKEFELIKQNFVNEDMHSKILFGKSKELNAISFSQTSKILDYVNLAPNGVLSFQPFNLSMPATSSSMGIIITNEDSIEIHSFLRASDDNVDSYERLKFQSLADILGGNFEITASHGGWKFNPKSELRETYIQAYKDIFGHTPKIEGIHAGLECGIILSKVKHNLDIISVGPQMHDIHTPKEKLNINSAETFLSVVSNCLRML